MSNLLFLNSLAVPEANLREVAKKKKGLKGKSTEGSKWYIRTYLGIIRPVYSSTYIAELFYNALRCGQVHEGIVKKGVLIGTKMPDCYHLSILHVKKSSDDNAAVRLVYVNTRILAEDFVRSTEHFIKEMDERDHFASKMANRLSEHLKVTHGLIKSIDLPDHDVNADDFNSIYEFSSGSPDNPSGGYYLKEGFWDEG